MRFLARLVQQALTVFVIALLTLPAWGRYDDYGTFESATLTAADSPASAPLSEEIPSEEDHVVAPARVIAVGVSDAENAKLPELRGLDPHQTSGREAEDSFFRPPKQR